MRTPSVSRSENCRPNRTKGGSDGRKSEDNGEERKVIGTEIGVVFADTEGSIGNRFGFSEGGTINEFSPWTAIGETTLDGFGDTVDEGTESRGRTHTGNGLLGIGGGGGDGSGGGLGVGNWKNWCW
ncbi:hypothetical protein H5410_052869 [Solanum commersonii]|uniref:Uncharacterized protein n=1 Tax=Solanum commersonii TaxID=4109 RepID=A0A9J5X2R3_SOLCO|nr:hypothetical protein H5410_052869 [Solanum commersonii]